MDSHRTYIIRVKPGTKQSRVVEAVGDMPESYIVWTRARAVDGKANAEVIKLLSEYFGIPKRNVEIVSGEAGRIKRVRIK